MLIRTRPSLHHVRTRHPTTRNFGTIAVHKPHAGEYAFGVNINPFKFGRGVVKNDLGEDLKSFNPKRIVVFTDPKLSDLEIVSVAIESIKKAIPNASVVKYDRVAVEPTDVSFKEASKFAKDGNFDAFVSVGGGSVMDTCKAANLYSTYPPTDFLDYVNKPIGKAVPPPGPVKPHITVPTTSGTGSELTGIAVFDLLEMKAKTAIANKLLIPNLALIDPTATDTLPKMVIACSGFDVLSHAIESYTARPYHSRAPPSHPSLRPLHQGANPYSDFGCLEALRLTGKYFLRAVNDPKDVEAREYMLFAATIAGSCMGNCGTHLPHGLSYPVSGLVSSFRPKEGYPTHDPIIPHGMSVVLNAPAAFRFAAPTNPERHLKAAELLGANTKDVHLLKDAGEVLADIVIHYMKNTGMPSGLSAVGYGDKDIEKLVEGAWPQKRVIDNAPVIVTKEDLGSMYKNAMKYW